MKKILPIILLLLLAGCSKTISYEDVRTSYDEAYAAAINEASAYENYSISQFQDLTSTVVTKLKDLENKMNEENSQKALSLYRDTILLEQLSSRSNSLQSRELSEFCTKIEELIPKAYDKDDAFAREKESLLSEGENILTWTEEDWRLVEIRKKILWNEVSSSYEAMEEELKASFPDAQEMQETDLEHYKNIILASYMEIKDGIDETNRQCADEIYSSAYALKYYTEDLESNSAIRVTTFADQAMKYVMESYGVSIEDPDYDFFREAENASKFTLSMWNEIIKELNY